MLPITPQGNARSFYQRPPPSHQEAAGFFLRFAPRLLVVAFATAGCGSVDDARFTASDAGLELTWRTAPGARVLVFCGPPDGPHYPRNDGRAWTTTAADPYGRRVKPAGEGRADATGAAHLVVPWSDLAVGDGFVVQALSFDDAASRDKARVSGAVVVRGRGNAALLLPHAAALFLGPRLLGWLAAAGVLALVVVLRRRRRAPPRTIATIARVAAALAAAAGVVALAVRRDPETESARLVRNLGRDLSGAAALDRALGPGAAALLDAFATTDAGDGPPVVVAARPGGTPSAAARFAAAARPHDDVRLVDGPVPLDVGLLLRLGVAAPPLDAPDEPGTIARHVGPAGRLTTPLREARSAERAASASRPAPATPASRPATGAPTSEGGR